MLMQEQAQEMFVADKYESPGVVDLSPIGAKHYEYFTLQGHTYNNYYYIISYVSQGKIFFPGTCTYAMF